MSFSEQADSSAESNNPRTSYEALQFERSRATSIGGYIGSLARHYAELPGGEASMLQLQRASRMITNPINEPTFPDALTHAFYWGEIIGYRIQDLVSDGEFVENAYANLNETIMEEYEGVTKTTATSSPDRLQLSSYIFESLKEIESGVFDDWQNLLVETWSQELLGDAEQQQYFILGTRFMLMQNPEHRGKVGIAVAARRYISSLTEEQSLDERVFYELLSRTDIDDVQLNPDNNQPLDGVQASILESYTQHRLAYQETVGDKELPEDAATILTRLLQRDFNELEGLQAGDWIRIEDDAMLTFFYLESGGRDVRLIEPGGYLEGRVQTVVVDETPTLEYIAEMRLGVADSSEDSLRDIGSLGVMLCIDYPVVTSAEGEQVAMGSEVLAGVYLSDSDLYMSKYIL